MKSCQWNMHIRGVSLWYQCLHLLRFQGNQGQQLVECGFKIHLSKIRQSSNIVWKLAFHQGSFPLALQISGVKWQHFNYLKSQVGSAIEVLESVVRDFNDSKVTFMYE